MRGSPPSPLTPTPRFSRANNVCACGWVCGPLTCIKCINLPPFALSFSPFTSLFSPPTLSPFCYCTAMSVGNQPLVKHPLMVHCGRRRRMRPPSSSGQIFLLLLLHLYYSRNSFSLLLPAAVSIIKEMLGWKKRRRNLLMKKKRRGRTFLLPVGWAVVGNSTCLQYHLFLVMEGERRYHQIFDMRGR